MASLQASQGCRLVLEGVVEHGRNDASEEGTGDFETGVGIGFDEVDAEVLVDHEVVSKDLHIDR